MTIFLWESLLVVRWWRTGIFMPLLEMTEASVKCFVTLTHVSVFLLVQQLLSGLYAHFQHSQFKWWARGWRKYFLGGGANDTVNSRTTFWESGWELWVGNDQPCRMIDYPNGRKWIHVFSFPLYLPSSVFRTGLSITPGQGLDTIGRNAADQTCPTHRVDSVGGPSADQGH